MSLSCDLQWSLDSPSSTNGDQNTFQFFLLAEFFLQPRVAERFNTGRRKEAGAERQGEDWRTKNKCITLWQSWPGYNSYICSTLLAATGRDDITHIKGQVSRQKWVARISPTPTGPTTSQTGAVHKYLVSSPFVFLTDIYLINKSDNSGASLFWFLNSPRAYWKMSVWFQFNLKTISQDCSRQVKSM